MQTRTIEVGELVSTLSAAGVGRQLSTLPGVLHADVNYVAGSATVRYDESRITLEAIQQRVVECGYHCRGELVPPMCVTRRITSQWEMAMRGTPVTARMAPPVATAPRTMRAPRCRRRPRKTAMQAMLDTVRIKAPRQARPTRKRT